MRRSAKEIFSPAVDQTYGSFGWTQDGIAQAVIQTAQYLGMDDYVRDITRMIDVTNRLVERVGEKPPLKHHNAEAGLWDLKLLLQPQHRSAIKVTDELSLSGGSREFEIQAAASAPVFKKPIDQLRPEDFTILVNNRSSLQSDFFFVDLLALVTVSKAIRNTLPVSPVVNDKPAETADASAMTVAGRLLMVLKDGETSRLAAQFIEIVSNPADRKILGRLFDEIQLERPGSAVLETASPTK